MSAARGHSRATSARARLVLALLLSAAASAGAQATGHIKGVVTAGASPISNALAVLDGSRETRSDSAGRFAFRDVPAGRHSLDVRSIGASPFQVFVIVPAGDSVEFPVQLEKIVTLDSVLVEGSTVRQGFVRAHEDRKRIGLGKFLDSAEVRKFAAVYQAVSFVPGVRRHKSNDTVYFTEGGGSLCLPNVWIDMQNWGTDQGVLKTIRPDDVMAVEVYARTLLIPDEFRARGVDRGCGALVIWTRRLWPQGKGK
jgi:hypothetical protein